MPHQTPTRSVQFLDEARDREWRARGPQQATGQRGSKWPSPGGQPLSWRGSAEKEKALE